MSDEDGHMILARPGSNRSLVATVHGSNVYGAGLDYDRIVTETIAETAANARLIALAPEMAEALRLFDCIRVADNFREIASTVPMYRGIPQDNLSVRIERARAILARIQP